MVKYYSKDLMELPNQNLPIKIYQTGSSGNSLNILPIRSLIDLGIPLRRYTIRDLANLDYVLLTHHHSDHLKLATLARMLDIYPHIKVLISDELYSYLDMTKPELIKNIKSRLIVFSFKEILTLKTRDNVIFNITPRSTNHVTLINTAYDITIPSYNTRMLYATDLNTTKPNNNLDGLPSNPTDLFNCILLEANYDENILKPFIEQHDYRAEQNLRHLSNGQAKAYISQHLTKNGTFIPLHASTAFGTYFQE